MDLEYSVTIHRPIDEVFAFASDPDRDPEWGTLMVESVKTTPGPLGVGSVFQQTAAFMGIRATIQLEVTAYRRCELMGYRVVQPLNAEHHRLFEETLEGTRLTFYTRVDPPRQYQLGVSIMRRGAQRQMETDMNRMKERLESTPANPATH